MGKAYPVADTIFFHETKHGITFDIHVTPHASRAEITGGIEGMLKIKVTAPPVEGAANEACIALLSKRLGLKKSQVEIVAGAKGRKKTVLARDIGIEKLKRQMHPFDWVDRREDRSS